MYIMIICCNLTVIECKKNTEMPCFVFLPLLLATKMQKLRVPGKTIPSKKKNKFRIKYEKVMLTQSRRVLNVYTTVYSDRRVG